MYICLDCGHVFDEPDTWNEHHPYGEGYATEAWSGCPRCKGGYEEAVECNVCGEYFSKSDLTDGICDRCYEEQEEGEYDE